MPYIKVATQLGFFEIAFTQPLKEIPDMIALKDLEYDILADPSDRRRLQSTLAKYWKPSF